MGDVELVAIVARADNGVIGRGGRLPWHIPADLGHFRRLTLDKPMIMGRRTFASLPGLLPRRRHIVLTRDLRWQAEGAEVAHNVDAALRLAGSEASVIGGAETFALFADHLTRMEVTEVHADVVGDTCLPAPGPEWRETARVDQPADNDAPALSFVTLLRR